MPIYNLNVAVLDLRAVVRVVRIDQESIHRAKIILPRWEEPQTGWDGPHTMEIGLPLANDYAWEYGYYGIAIDIESSQLWGPKWGAQECPSDIE